MYGFETYFFSPRLMSGRERINTKNRIIKTSYPNQLWVVDLIGRIPGPNGSNKFIFIAIDHYTKWVETAIVKKKRGEDISLLIKKLIIDKHGLPKKILSDNGLEFKNKPICNLVKTYNLEWVFSSPNHHQTVGVVERANQSLMNKLRKLTKFGTLSWENKLKEATNALNYSFNRSIRTSPYMFMYKRLPLLPIDAVCGEKDKVLSADDLLKERDNNFDRYAKKYIEKGRIRVNNDLNIGDKVFIYKKILAGKLKPEWHDGYKVEKIITPDAYIVTNGRKSYRLNKSHLKLDSTLGREVS